MKSPSITGQLPLEVAPPTADEITAAILAYLDHHGYCAWRQPNRGEYDPTTGKWRRHPNARRGVPDIIGFRRRDGIFIGVEVKAGSDRLRPEQKQFLDQLKAAGGLPFIAHSFEEFRASFEHRRLH